MYTLKPKPIKPVSVFGLDFKPTSRSFTGTVFRGHLERGGQIIDALRDVDVTVKRVVYSRKFDLKQLQKWEELDYILFGSGQELFLAHLISAPPDFDQILSIKIDRTVYRRRDKHQGAYCNSESNQCCIPKAQGKGENPSARPYHWSASVLRLTDRSGCGVLLRGGRTS